MSDGYNYKRWEWLKGHFVRLSYGRLWVMDAFSTGSESNTAEAGEKKKKLFLKKRGHSVTFSSKGCINAESNLSIEDLLCIFQYIRWLHPEVKPLLMMISLRTVTSAFSIHVMQLRCQTLNCYKMGTNVSRHLRSDYSLVHVTLPSGLRARRYVYVSWVWLKAVITILNLRFSRFCQPVCAVCACVLLWYSG